MTEERKQYKFTIILDHRLKHIITEPAYRRLLRLELCEIFGFKGRYPIVQLNNRCKSGAEPTASQMAKMKRAFAKYGIKKDEIFDKE